MIMIKDLKVQGASLVITFIKVVHIMQEVNYIIITIKDMVIIDIIVIMGFKVKMDSYNFIIIITSMHHSCMAIITFILSYSIFYQKELNPFYILNFIFN